MPAHIHPVDGAPSNPPAPSTGHTRRPLAALAALALAATGCSRTDLAAWVAWHDTDPAAAEAFAADPDVQADLATGEHEAVLTNDHAARWDAIARCESGGNWDYPLVTNRTGTYSGGLMIWTKAWTVYGGHEFAPNAYQASKAEQIEVAERILADNGWDAWDCA